MRSSQSSLSKLLIRICRIKREADPKNEDNLEAHKIAVDISMTVVDQKYASLLSLLNLFI